MLSLRTGRIGIARLLPAALSGDDLSVRTVKTKAVRLPSDKPAPWPYREKGYQRLHVLMDWTKKRFDENTKLFVVDGNIGAGKSTLAKALAEQFDFHYVAEPTMDNFLVSPYGKDLRDYYHLLPEKVQFFDLKMFYENPSHPNVAKFQHLMFWLKYETMCNALAHLFNTGQGVVMDRNVFSDFVFVEAMVKKGFLGQNFHTWYGKLSETVMPFLFHKPHVVVYLDASVEKCLDNIKKRGLPYENNGKVIDAAYLKTIEDQYKRIYLPAMKRTSEVLVYNWEDGGDAEIIADDIEKLDLDTYDWHVDEKFESWALMREEFEWCDIRRMYTEKRDLFAFFNVPAYEVADLYIHPEDGRKLQTVCEEHTHGYYNVGLNPGKDSVWNILKARLQTGPTRYPWQEYSLGPELVYFLAKSFPHYQ